MTARSSIVDLVNDAASQPYALNVVFDYRLSDVLQQWNIPWRFTTDYRAAQFKAYKRSMERNLATSLIHFLDTHVPPRAARSKRSLAATEGWDTRRARDDGEREPKRWYGERLIEAEEMGFFD